LNRKTIMTSKINTSIPVCVLIAVLLLSPAATATPRLAAEYGQDCHLCHVNPTGGGLRNSFVSQYIGPSELTMRPLPAHEKTRWPSTRITDQITIGTDLRMLYVGHDAVATGSGSLDNTFFQMQGDIYLAFEPDPEFVIYLDKGLRDGFEVFVLARVLPYHGYLKAGQFVPDIGWRWDDHTRYTREKLGLDFPGATDAGIEIGLRPNRTVISAGLFNGTRGGLFDNNSQKAAVLRVLRRLSVGKLQLAAGGTARLNRFPGGRERLWGLLGQANWGPVSYLGDFYWQRTEIIGNHRVRAWLFSQEIDWRVYRGADLFVGFDFLDPDLDFASGSQTQWTFGGRFYLRHFLKLEPVFRVETGETVPGRRTNNRFEILLHAFY
jgi:hypothetical protein